MADTIQAVHWRGGGQLEGGYLTWLPSRESTNDVLWRSIVRTGLESQLRRSFHVTDPIWYGLWIDSPLSQPQCDLLHRLFSDVASSSPAYRRSLGRFLSALQCACDTREPMAIELSPPGHVDFGWHTVFVHCPRCKAEGPLERWQESYPVEPIECPVCGHGYSPAATHSSEPYYFAESVTCPACNLRFRVKEFGERDIKLLEDHYYYRQFRVELSWLLRVAAFYDRHPERRRRLKRAGTPPPNASDDGTHQPVLARADAPEWSAEDLEVMAYLRHNLFSLEHRLEFVAEAIERLAPVVERNWVGCPTCGKRLEP
ncbi:MAG TPA: hypothetical protein VFW87_23410 [Pirellulales bacterium]|nr:hypothetical protein [Pirellulales bacterium]